MHTCTKPGKPTKGIAYHVSTDKNLAAAELVSLQHEWCNAAGCNAIIMSFCVSTGYHRTTHVAGPLCKVSCAVAIGAPLFRRRPLSCVKQRHNLRQNCAVRGSVVPHTQRKSSTWACWRGPPVQLWVPQMAVLATYQHKTSLVC